MSTFAEYDAELQNALEIETGGLRRESDELRRDRVPEGGNAFQLRHSAAPLDPVDGNTRILSHTTAIVVYHYLATSDPGPEEAERDYTLGEMQRIQEALLFHGLWIEGWPGAPAHGLTTVQGFWQNPSGQPAIEETFERIGRTIAFTVTAAINLNL